MYVLLIYDNVEITNTEFVSYDVNKLGKVILDIYCGETTDESQVLNVSYNNSDDEFNLLYEMLDESVVVNVINMFSFYNSRCFNNVIDFEKFNCTLKKNF